MTKKVHNIYRVGIIDKNSVNVEIQCAYKAILDTIVLANRELLVIISNSRLLLVYVAKQAKRAYR